MESESGQTAPPKRGDYWRLWIRRADQITLGCILLGCLSILLVWIGSQVFRSPQWIEVERAQPLSAAYIVDINRAPWPEIANLPGIGENLAREIIAYRELHGPFNSADALQAVRGIGPRKVERLRPYLASFEGGPAQLVRQ